MPSEPTEFDATSVAAAWDYGADAYAAFQAAGYDHYRYAFFGPAQVARCGDVAGLRVLDLGCGNGYFSRAMAERGATVIGVDISAGQIGHAERIEQEQPLGITYQVLDAVQVAEAFAPGSFDLVTSCVALQDMPDTDRVIAGAFTVLRAGGRFVPCITHPATDTPFREWERDAEGHKVALRIDRYFERTTVTYRWAEWEGRMPYPWVSAGRHVTLGDWMGWFLAAGFVLRGFEEPEPTADALTQHPDLEDAARVPYFALFDWQKPGAE